MNPRALLSILLALSLFVVGRAHELFGIGRSVGDMAQDAPTFATPAPYTFLIWLLIFTLWTLMAFRQLRAPQQEQALWDRIAWPMVGVMAASNAWMLVAIMYGNGLPLLALIVALFGCLLVALGRTLASLQTGTPETRFTRCVVLPGLSVAAGWVTLATFLNLAGVLQLSFGLPTGTVTGSVVTLMAALITALVMVRRLRHPVAMQGYALAVIWGLSGVVIGNSALSHSAIGSISLPVAIVAWCASFIVLAILAGSLTSTVSR